MDVWVIEVIMTVEDSSPVVVIADVVVSLRLPVLVRKAQSVGEVVYHVLVDALLELV